MAILYGTTGTGETLPVEVNEFGQLIAEGLPGQPGPPGPPGLPELPPDPFEGAVLGWKDNTLSWLGGSVPLPPGTYGPITAYQGGVLTFAETVDLPYLAQFFLSNNAGGELIWTPSTSLISNVTGEALNLTDDMNLANFRVGDAVQELNGLYSLSVVGTDVSAVDAEIVFDGDTSVYLQAPTSGITWTAPAGGIAYTTARVFVVDIYACDPSIVLDDICRYSPSHTLCVGLPLCPGVAWDPVQGPSADQSTYRCSYVSSTGGGTLGAGTFSSTGQWLTIPGGPGVLDSVSWISGGSPRWGIAVAAIEIDGVILLDKYTDTYKVTTIDEAAPSITVDGGKWLGTDGSGVLDGERTVIGPEIMGQGSVQSVIGNTIVLREDNGGWKIGEYITVPSQALAARYVYIDEIRKKLL